MKAVLLSQTIYRYTLLVNTKNLTESYMFSTYYNVAATPLSHSILYPIIKIYDKYRESSTCEIIKGCIFVCVGQYCVKTI